MSDTTPFAVITGASSGIGLELAKVFAGNGFDLLVAAEDEGINAVPGQLSGDGRTVQPVRVDLRDRDGVEELYRAITASGRPVDAAALNAGVGGGGAFIDQDPADIQSIIDLNVTSTVQLAHRLLRDMASRDAGRVLVTSSIGSTMPGPYQAIYNASKSFLQSLTEALQNELADTGVVITSLMPGPTETEFFDRAGLQDTAMGQGSKDDAAQVAQQGFDALMSGESKVVAGSLKTKASEALTGVLPDKVKAKAHQHMAEPRQG